MKLAKWLLFILVIFVGLGVLGTELNKAYWDSQVRAMCEKDGGVTVYERVYLTQEQYEKNDGYMGGISVFSKTTSKLNHDFYREGKYTVIKKSNPEVVRSEYITYRKLDNKPLGKWVTYFRRGGDLPIGFHPSSFSCRELASFESNAVKKIFKINME